MKKTPQAQIDRNAQWAKNNVNKTRQYKRKYKYEQKRLAREYIQSIKQQSGCKTCGNNNIRCLDFHHRPRTKKKNTVCNLVRHGYSFEIIKKEIKKCDIICSNCHRTYHYTGRYMRNKKGLLVYGIKSQSKCLYCNCSNIECLDFHHTENNKEDHIGAMIRDKRVSMEQIETEIKKCIILCSNCHRILHANDREKEH
jgi:hypothetical protein